MDDVRGVLAGVCAGAQPAGYEGGAPGGHSRWVGLGVVYSWPTTFIWAVRGLSRGKTLVIETRVVRWRYFGLWKLLVLSELQGLFPFDLW